eukprot:TRINITY_DN11814_c1_g1_i3.p1 TRINITY_DN11814_c1_g1~~TRINITY_DN11814_c1_g1_i3.p1  ORF type:complete len:3016 (+),score=660.88 TRINITY_DN11814_c1_g1_i3:455-9049(+)
MDDPRTRVQKLYNMVSMDELMQMMKEVAEEIEDDKFFKAVEHVVNEHRDIVVADLIEELAKEKAAREALYESVAKMRQLELELKSLRGAGAELQKLKETRLKERKAFEAEIHETRDALEAARAELADLKDNTASLEKSTSARGRAIEVMKETYEAELQEMRKRLAEKEDRLKKLILQKKDTVKMPSPVSDAEPQTPESIKRLVLDIMSRHELFDLVQAISESLDADGRGELIQAVSRGRSASSPSSRRTTKQAVVNNVQGDPVTLLSNMDLEEVKQFIRRLPVKVARALVVEGVQSSILATARHSTTDSSDEDRIQDLEPLDPAKIIIDPTKNLSKKVRYELVLRLCKVMTKQDVESVAGSLPEKARRNFLLSTFEKASGEDLRRCAKLCTDPESVAMFASALDRETNKLMARLTVTMAPVDSRAELLRSLAAEEDQDEIVRLLAHPADGSSASAASNAEDDVDVEDEEEEPDPGDENDEDGESKGGSGGRMERELRVRASTVSNEAFRVSRASERAARRDMVSKHEIACQTEICMYTDENEEPVLYVLGDFPLLGREVTDEMEMAAKGFLLENGALDFEEQSPLSADARRASLMPQAFDLSNLDEGAYEREHSDDESDPSALLEQDEMQRSSAKDSPALLSDEEPEHESVAGAPTSVAEADDAAAAAAMPGSSIPFLAGEATDEFGTSCRRRGEEGTTDVAGNGCGTHGSDVAAGIVMDAGVVAVEDMPENLIQEVGIGDQKAEIMEAKTSQPRVGPSTVMTSPSSEDHSQSNSLHNVSDEPATQREHGSEDVSQSLADHRSAKQQRKAARIKPTGSQDGLDGHSKVTTSASSQDQHQSSSVHNASNEFATQREHGSEEVSASDAEHGSAKQQKKNETRAQPKKSPDRLDGQATVTTNPLSEDHNQSNLPHNSSHEAEARKANGSKEVSMTIAEHSSAKDALRNPVDLSQVDVQVGQDSHNVEGRDVAPQVTESSSVDQAAPSALRETVQGGIPVHGPSGSQKPESGSGRHATFVEQSPRKSHAPSRTMPADPNGESRRSRRDKGDTSDAVESAKGTARRNISSAGKQVTSMVKASKIKEKMTNAATQAQRAAGRAREELMSLVSSSMREQRELQSSVAATEAEVLRDPTDAAAAKRLLSLRQQLGGARRLRVAALNAVVAQAEATLISSGGSDPGTVHLAIEARTRLAQEALSDVNELQALAEQAEQEMLRDPSNVAATKRCAEVWCRRTSVSARRVGALADLKAQADGALATDPENREALQARSNAEDQLARCGKQHFVDLIPMLTAADSLAGLEELRGDPKADRASLEEGTRHPFDVTKLAVELKTLEREAQSAEAACDARPDAEELLALAIQARAKCTVATNLRLALLQGTVAQAQVRAAADPREAAVRHAAMRARATYVEEAQKSLTSCGSSLLRSAERHSQRRSLAGADLARKAALSQRADFIALARQLRLALKAAIAEAEASLMLGIDADVLDMVRGFQASLVECLDHQESVLVKAAPLLERGRLPPSLAKAKAKAQPAKLSLAQAEENGCLRIEGAGVVTVQEEENAQTTDNMEFELGQSCVDEAISQGALALRAVVAHADACLRLDRHDDERQEAAEDARERLAEAARRHIKAIEAMGKQADEVAAMPLTSSLAVPSEATPSAETIFASLAARHAAVQQLKSDLLTCSQGFDAEDEHGVMLAERCGKLVEEVDVAHLAALKAAAAAARKLRLHGRGGSSEQGEQHALDEVIDLAASAHARTDRQATWRKRFGSGGSAGAEDKADGDEEGSGHAARLTQAGSVKFMSGGSTASSPVRGARLHDTHAHSAPKGPGLDQVAGLRKAMLSAEIEAADAAAQAMAASTVDGRWSPSRATSGHSPQAEKAEQARSALSLARASFARGFGQEALEIADVIADAESKVTQRLGETARRAAFAAQERFEQLSALWPSPVHHNRKRKSKADGGRSRSPPWAHRDGCLLTEHREGPRRLQREVSRGSDASASSSRSGEGSGRSSDSGSSSNGSSSGSSRHRSRRRSTNRVQNVSKEKDEPPSTQKRLTRITAGENISGALMSLGSRQPTQPGPALARIGGDAMSKRMAATQSGVQFGGTFGDAGGVGLGVGALRTTAGPSLGLGAGRMSVMSLGSGPRGHEQGAGLAGGLAALASIGAVPSLLLGNTKQSASGPAPPAALAWPLGADPRAPSASPRGFAATVLSPRTTKKKSPLGRAATTEVGRVFQGVGHGFAANLQKKASVDAFMGSITDRSRSDASRERGETLPGLAETMGNTRILLPALPALPNQPGADAFDGALGMRSAVSFGKFPNEKPNSVRGPGLLGKGVHHPTQHGPQLALQQQFASPLSPRTAPPLSGGHALHQGYAQQSSSSSFGAGLGAGLGSGPPATSLGLGGVFGPSGALSARSNVGGAGVASGAASTAALSLGAATLAVHSLGSSGVGAPVAPALPASALSPASPRARADVARLASRLQRQDAGGRGFGDLKATPYKSKQSTLQISFSGEDLMKVGRGAPNAPAKQPKEAGRGFARRASNDAGAINAAMSAGKARRKSVASENSSGGFGMKDILVGIATARASPGTHGRASPREALQKSSKELTEDDTCSPKSRVGPSNIDDSGDEESVSDSSEEGDSSSATSATGEADAAATTLAGSQESAAQDGASAERPADSEKPEAGSSQAKSDSKEDVQKQELVGNVQSDVVQAEAQASVDDSPAHPAPTLTDEPTAAGEQAEVPSADAEPPKAASTEATEPGRPGAASPSSSAQPPRLGAARYFRNLRLPAVSPLQKETSRFWRILRRLQAPNTQGAPAEAGAGEADDAAAAEGNVGIAVTVLLQSVMRGFLVRRAARKRCVQADPGTSSAGDA